MREQSEHDLQNLDKDDDKDAEMVTPKSDKKESPVDSDVKDTDSNFSDNDESGDMNRVHIRLPMDLNLDELANALVENNQK